MVMSFDVGKMFQLQNLNHNTNFFTGRIIVVLAGHQVVYHLIGYHSICCT
jgi:hypothetical protein